MPEMDPSAAQLGLIAMAKDSQRLHWLLDHALGDIEIEINGVVRSVRTRDDIDQAMSEEKPRAE
jgi:hypothetical protein